MMRIRFFSLVIIMFCCNACQTDGNTKPAADSAATISPIITKADTFHAEVFHGYAWQIIRGSSFAGIQERDTILLKTIPAIQDHYFEYLVFGKDGTLSYGEHFPYRPALRCGNGIFFLDS